MCLFYIYLLSILYITVLCSKKDNIFFFKVATKSEITNNKSDDDNPNGGTTAKSYSENFKPKKRGKFLFQTY